MRHRALPLLAATVVGVVALTTPTATAADATLGDTVVPDTACGTGALTAFQTTSPGARYAAATDGVITSWRVRGGEKASTRTLKVGRQDGDAVLVVGSGTTGLAVPAEALVTQDVRVPVESGDFLGFATTNDARCASQAPGGGYTQVAFAGELATGARLVPVFSGDLQLDVAATVEPDVDADGYGDTTQDRCPSQAATHGACRDVLAPDTSVTSTRVGRTRARTGKAQLIVGFTADEAGATFTCKVDRARAKPCRNPLVVSLRKGRHTVVVTASDTAGNADPTPARVTVRVKARR